LKTSNARRWFNMDNKAIVDAVRREVVEPGIERLIDNLYFSELRKGTLSKRRLQGWALQHDLVRESAQHTARIKLGKFEGIYQAYA